MKNTVISRARRAVYRHSFIPKTLLLLILASLFAVNVSAQFGNTISGFVFNSSRQPLSDVVVELLDEYSRTISRTKTSAAGLYRFSGMSAGRFRVRVLPYGTDFSEQEQDVEIQNITLRQPNGRLSVNGFENAQRDFYLRLRKNSERKEAFESLFVQEVPETAKKKYQKAVELLGDKKQKEAFEELKSAIEIFPTYFDALEKLGMEYVKASYFVPAEILLYNAVEVNPRAARSWYGLAYAQYSQNKISDAARSIEKAVSLNQSFIEAFLLYGVIDKRQGNFTQAEKHFLKAKELAKTSLPEIHRQLGLLYANNLKRYDEAVKELEIYLKAMPSGKESENIKELVEQIKAKSKEKK